MPHIPKPNDIADRVKGALGVVTDFSGFEEAANAIEMHVDNGTKEEAHFGVTVEGRPYTIIYLGPKTDTSTLEDIFGDEDAFEVKIVSENGDSQTMTVHASGEKAIANVLRAGVMQHHKGKDI